MTFSEDATKFIIKNYKIIFYVAIALSLFYFVWSIISYSASTQTSNRYKDSTNGLFSAEPPTNEQIQADAKAAQDRDAMNLGIAVAVLFFVLVPIFLFLSNGGGDNGTGFAVGAIAGTYA